MDGILLKWLIRLEMLLITWVQILNKTVSIYFMLMPLEKVLIPLISPISYQ